MPLSAPELAAFQRDAQGVTEPTATGAIEFLPLATEAACLDGSPYAFYSAPATTTAGKTRWSINIEGGGWCYNETLCYERSLGRLGSSKGWPKTAGLGCAIYQPDGTALDCQSIYMPYGDGASFSGYVKDPVPKSAWPLPLSPPPAHPIPDNATLTFRGIRNFDATVDRLFEMGIGNATEVVLTGGSAGGLSTFLHADRLAARIHAVNPHAKVRAMPVVGYFLDHANAAHGPQNYTAWMKYIHTMQNLTVAMGKDATEGGALDPACVEHYSATDDVFKCFMSPHMNQFIDTPFFMLNSKYDAWQADNILQLPCATNPKVRCNDTEQQDVLDYGSDFLTDFAPVETDKGGQDGAFITSCICHGCPWSDLVLQGKNTYQAVGTWYAASLEAERRTGSPQLPAGNEHILIDPRHPNGDGTITNQMCDTFP